MSRPFAVISVIWIILITPLFLYPFGLNPAALATVAGFLILLAVYYLLWARTRFAGPRRQGTDAELTEIEREFERAAARARDRDCLTTSHTADTEGRPQPAGPRTNH